MNKQTSVGKIHKLVLLKINEKKRKEGVCIHTNTLHPLILSFSYNILLSSQGDFLIQSLAQGLTKGSLGCTSTGEHRAGFPGTLNIRTGFHPSLIPLPLNQGLYLSVLSSHSVSMANEEIKFACKNTNIFSCLFFPCFLP